MNLPTTQRVMLFTVVHSVIQSTLPARCIRQASASISTSVLYTTQRKNHGIISSRFRTNSILFNSRFIIHRGHSQRSADHVCQSQYLARGMAWLSSDSVLNACGTMACRAIQYGTVIAIHPTGAVSSIHGVCRCRNPGFATVCILNDCKIRKWEGLSPYHEC